MDSSKHRVVRDLSETPPVSGVDLVDTIAGYALLAPLGQGGFARVFRAEHTQTHRVVALKVLHFAGALDEPTRERHRGRFWRESALCADLHHPHIVGLVDRGQTADGELFAAYEFVPGETLRELLDRRGALPAHEAAHLMGQVLDALACAHAAGVIHRDLKPENIMVTQTGAQAHAVVLDFGVGAFTEHARREDYAHLTLSREAVGTPAYAAPEQLRGEVLTPKSDIYAWALVLLECLTGAPPIAGDNLAQVLRLQLDPTEIPLPSGLLGTSLGTFLRRCLRKDPLTRAGEPAALHAEFQRLNFASLVGPLAFKEEQPVNAAFSATVDALNPYSDRLVTGERRILSLLCCGVDIVGEVALPSAQEHLEYVQRELLSLAKDVFERFGGWVAGTLAGRMIVYFGYPRAGDGDALRAANAALEALEQMRTSLATRPESSGRIQSRAALHTGPIIFTNDSPTDGMTQGAVLLLATRAPAWGVLLTSATERLIRQASELVLITEALERAEDSERVFRMSRAGIAATGARSSASRLLFGRASELEALREIWRDAKEGRGNLVLVTGEAGVGKSALVRAFVEQSRLEAAVVAECRCLSDHRNSALHPLLELLKQSWALSATALGDGTQAALESRLVSLGFDPALTVPIVSTWLALPIPVGYEVPKESAERQKLVLFEILRRQFVNGQAGRTNLLLVEDLHWADQLTLEFLSSATAVAGATQCLVLLTSRPELTPAWSDKAKQIAILGLEPGAVNQMARDICGLPLTEDALNQISARTNGVPLFVQEVLRMLQEEQLLVVGDGAYALARPLEATTVPLTLREALSERLSHLGDARETAALAAALGRDFSSDVLGALSNKAPASLEADLARLCQRNLIVLEGVGESGQKHYSFRHALIREVAYDSMLSSNQVVVHARIAEVLTTTFPEQTRTQPGLIARHCAAGRRFLSAVEHGTRAAHVALARAANIEAANHAEMALEWTLSLPAEERVNAQLRANGPLTQALMATRGWGDPQVKQRVDFSNALLEQQPLLELEVQARWALMTYHYVASNRAQLRKLATEFADMAKRSGDLSLAVAAHTFSGLVEHGSGHYGEAELEFSSVRALYDREQHRGHGLSFGIDSHVWASATLALVRWFRNDAAMAHALAAEAIEWARELEHVPSVGIALLYAANLAHYAQDKVAVAAYCEELLALDAKYGYPAYGAYGALLKAWALGDTTLPVAVVGQLHAMGCTAALSYYASLVAETDAEHGRLDAALERIRYSLDLCNRNDEQYYAPELHRLRASCLTRQGKYAAARDELTLTMKLAADQGMVWTESRAAQALGQLAVTA